MGNLVVLISKTHLFKYREFYHQKRKLSDEIISKAHLFKYIENFTTKNENFQMKNSRRFHISAQNVDCASTHNLCFKQK